MSDSRSAIPSPPPLPLEPAVPTAPAIPAPPGLPTEASTNLNGKKKWATVEIPSSTSSSTPKVAEEKSAVDFLKTLLENPESETYTSEVASLLQQRSDRQKNAADATNNDGSPLLKSLATLRSEKLSLLQTLKDTNADEGIGGRLIKQVNQCETSLLSKPLEDRLINLKINILLEYFDKLYDNYVELCKEWSTLDSTNQKTLKAQKATEKNLKWSELLAVKELLQTTLPQPVPVSSSSIRASSSSSGPVDFKQLDQQNSKGPTIVIPKKKEATTNQIKQFLGILKNLHEQAFNDAVEHMRATGLLGTDVSIPYIDTTSPASHLRSSSSVSATSNGHPTTSHIKSSHSLDSSLSLTAASSSSSSSSSSQVSNEQATQRIQELEDQIELMKQVAHKKISKLKTTALENHNDSMQDLKEGHAAEIEILNKTIAAFKHQIEEYQTENSKLNKTLKALLDNLQIMYQEIESPDQKRTSIRLQRDSVLPTLKGFSEELTAIKQSMQLQANLFPEEMKRFEQSLPNIMQKITLLKKEGATYKKIFTFSDSAESKPSHPTESLAPKNPNPEIMKTLKDQISSLSLHSIHLIQGAFYPLTKKFAEAKTVFMNAKSVAKIVGQPAGVEETMGLIETTYGEINSLINSLENNMMEEVNKLTRESDLTSIQQLIHAQNEKLNEQYKKQPSNANLAVRAAPPRSHAHPVLLPPTVSTSKERKPQAQSSNSHHQQVRLSASAVTTFAAAPSTHHSNAPKMTANPTPVRPVTAKPPTKS